ncbi:MAG TPA: Gldg family protein, partial [Pseudomonadales bacterium]|nr:Gldg family protein [Pseudomonadales bacterium]
MTEQVNSSRFRWQKLPFALHVVLLVFALLVGAVLLASLNKWQIDLTQGKLYTLSQGTRNILAQVQQPITLKLYYSESLTRDIPMLRNYASRVQDMLREYEHKSHGKIKLQ